MPEPRVGLRFRVDNGLGVDPSINKMDYEVVYKDPEIEDQWVIRVFYKGGKWLTIWDDEDFEQTLVEI